VTAARRGEDAPTVPFPSSPLRRWLPVGLALVGLFGLGELAALLTGAA
jgi:hypothetical protein